MKTLLLIDANALIHRSFHALPPFKTPEGKPTGAIYGLASVLIKIFRETPPDYIAALFDRPEPTFRKEVFKEYKIQRPKAPDELVSQLIEAHNLFDAFGIKTFERPGFEADDLIGTLVEKYKRESDIKIIILTGDLDTLQLVEGEKVIVETPKKGIAGEPIIYDEAAVKERFGVSPNELPDYKGLAGDQSDNIPGVPGIGPKTASDIIKKYKTIEKFLSSGEKESGFAKINEWKEQALLSRHLAVIRRDAPASLNRLKDLEYKELPVKKLTSYFEKLSLRSLVKRINPSAEIIPRREPKRIKRNKETQKNTLF